MGTRGTKTVVYQEIEKVLDLQPGSERPAKIKRAQVPAGRQLLHRGAAVRDGAEAEGVYFGERGR